MPKKIQHTTKANLLSIDLPQHGASYTVISHEFIINYAHQALSAAGFIVLEEEYRCTADGQIAQGVYKLNYNNDPELAMMFAWTNSYNKQVKFKCVIGAYVNKTGSVMISGDIGSWVRKHTGTADTETQETIDSYISNAHMYYNQLCSDKASMETISLNKRKQSQLLGVLFAEYEILTTEQASMVRDQMKKPYHVFTNTDSLWAFYNYITIALQTSHPKTWMEDQRILHYFISSINNFVQAPAVVVVPVVEEVVVPDVYSDPNQVSLLDQIADMEADIIDEDIRYAANDEEERVLTEDELAHQLYGVDNDIEVSIAAPENEELNEEEVIDELEVEELTLEQPEESILQYTDKDGNTFESIEFHNAAVETSLTEKEIIEDSKDEFALADNFELDFNEETNEDPDSLPDFF
jgi:hypothetical protein